MKIANTTINVVNDDITDINVDAIVNSANINLTMGEGLASVIKKKAGSEIEEEALSQAPAKLGEAVVTSGGKLKANHVIHAVTMGPEKIVDQEYIRAATASALHCANKLGIRSIAFPAFGCGVGGFPVPGSARIIIQEVLKYLKDQEASLRQITFCIYEQDQFQEFDSTVRGYVHHIQTKLGPGPYITVDIIMEINNQGIVLIERSNPPYGWALPGGFVDYGESLEQAAKREAKEETNLDAVNLRQFHTYSEPGRDPRFHTVSAVFIAQGKGEPQSGSDAKNLKVVRYEELPQLDYAFDHKDIIKEYLMEREFDDNQFG